MTLWFTKQPKTNIDSVKEMKNSQVKAIMLYLGLKKQSIQKLNSSWVYFMQIQWSHLETHQKCDTMIAKGGVYIHLSNMWLSSLRKILIAWYNVPISTTGMVKVDQIKEDKINWHCMKRQESTNFLVLIHISRFRLLQGNNNNNRARFDLLCSILENNWKTDMKKAFNSLFNLIQHMELIKLL